MRVFVRKTLESILRVLSKATLAKFKPVVIGVTGSVGKTSTKFAIKAVLSSAFRVRASADSHNSEVGFPLAILGEWRGDDLRIISRDAAPGGKSFAKGLFWLKVIIVSATRLLFGSAKKYPEFLILEYGADRPGDIKYLAQIARPQIGVVTAVGDMPVHVEFYDGPDAVALEKGRLVEALLVSGSAALNSDDERVFAMKDKTRAKTITFGFGEGAQVRIDNFETKVESGKGIRFPRPIGVTFKLSYNGAFAPVRISGTLGRAQAYACAAAAAVGLGCGMNLVKIADALAYYQPPAHRFKFVAGVNESLLFDDAYNASPLSMMNALEAVGELKAKRKIGVLGDMRELGKFSQMAHEQLGRLAARSLDVLVVVGDYAGVVAEAAKKAKMPARSVIVCKSAEDALVACLSLIKSGDLVLIKASKAVGLKTVVEGLTARAEKLA